MSTSQFSYLPAVLKELPSLGWVLEYFVQQPETGKMVRQRIRLQRVRKRYSSQREFLTYAKTVQLQLNQRLAGGWSPLLEGENQRLYRPITEVVEAYLKDKSSEVRPDTMRCYSSICSMLVEWCGRELPGRFFGTFGRLQAVRYLDDYQQRHKCSARAWNNQLKGCRALFSWAVQHCYSQQNPFETIRPKRVGQKQRILIDGDSRARIVEWCEVNEPVFATVCELIFNSLIRPKEISLIRIQDIELEQHYIRIPDSNAKNHNTRFAALSPELVQRLQQMRLEKYPLGWYLFGSDLQPAKQHCHSSLFRKHWIRCREALGLPKEMQLYSFRDTGINSLLRDGVDTLTVMQAADHHDLSMTTRYADHRDEGLIERLYQSAHKF